MKTRFVLLLASLSLVACAPSSAKFATKYPTTDSVANALEHGAPKVGCRSETTFRGEEIRCSDDRSVKLIENDGHYDAECDHMSKGACEDLLQSMLDAGRNGS